MSHMTSRTQSSYLMHYYHSLHIDFCILFCSSKNYWSLLDINFVLLQVAAIIPCSVHPFDSICCACQTIRRHSKRVLNTILIFAVVGSCALFIHSLIREVWKCTENVYHKFPVQYEFIIFDAIFPFILRAIKPPFHAHQQIKQRLPMTFSSILPLLMSA